MVERVASRTESELAWAESAARELLSPLDARWAHTQRVAERAQSFRDVLDGGELDVLLAAAYVHDVGYAPGLVVSGFHPLDGDARYVRDCGHERLAGLVAHHSAADAEADERGLAAALAEFPAEDSLVARALTYCDLTTGPDGDYMDVATRFANIAERLGEDEPIARAVRRDATRLSALVDEMETVLAGNG
jgi:hypothetical protein